MDLDPTQRYITCIAANNSLLVVGLADYRVEIFNLKSISHVKTITQDLWEVKSVFLDQDYLLVSSLNEKLAIYDLKTFEIIKELFHPLGILKMWSDEKYIYSTSYNKEVWLWDRHTLQHVATLPNHSIRVNCVLSFDGTVLTGDGFTIPEGAVNVWNKQDLSIITKLNSPPSKRVNELKIHNNMLFSAHGSPGEIRVWDLSNFQLKSTLKTGHDCTSLAINDDYIVAAVKDKVMIWDSEFNFLREINEKGREVSSVVISDNNVIYGSRNTLKFYNLLNQRESKAIDL